MGVKLTSLIWGFAEATFFFIVPDVLLTLIALKNWRLATRACLWSLGGALIGGVIMYTWGASEPSSAKEFLEHVPSVDNELLQGVSREVESRGAMATFSGPFAGKPYKVYAVQAGASDVNLPLFLLISVPARLLRFLLAAWITAAIFNILLKRVKPRHKIVALCGFWIMFYACFLSVM